MSKKLLLLVFFFSLPFVLAQGLDYPHHFYGDAIYNNVAAPNGMVIDAYIDGAKIQSTTVLNGQYIFLVKDNEGIYEGKTITFYLNGINTGRTAVFENGESTKLDLSATGSTTPPVDTGNGGGGGGGGGGGTDRGTTTTTATTSTTGTSTSGTGEDTETGPETTTSADGEEQETRSGITGAIIGVLGTGGTIGAFIFIIAIIIIAIFVFVMRRREKGGVEEK